MLYVDIFFHFALQNGTLRLIDRKKHIFKLSQVNTVIAGRKMLYTFDIELSKVDACKLFNNLSYFYKVLMGLGIITSPAGNHSRPQSCNRCSERGFPFSAQPEKCETKAVAIGYKMGSCCAPACYFGPSKSSQSVALTTSIEAQFEDKNGSKLHWFFSGYSGFPLSMKKQHFQIPIRSGTHGHVSTSS